VSSSPFWLTHHVAEQHDRCAHVGGRLVCRRCLWSYPVAFTVMAASLAGVHWSTGLDGWLLWLMPAPAIAEFVLEHVAGLRYNPKRQALLSLVAGVAFGRGLGRYLESNGDRLFWQVSVTYSLVMVAAVIVRQVREKRAKERAVELESDLWWSTIEDQFGGSR
jgi:uncharacterized membrane protein (UPF0136 family)